MAQAAAAAKPTVPNVSVVLADDHAVVRQGLRSLLESQPGMGVVGEAADGIEASRMIERLQPDVAVLDLRMPGLGGIEVTRQVRKRAPATRVLVLSMYSDEAYVIEALRAGAHGYLLKTAATGELVRAVRQVAAGQHYLSPPLAQRAIESYVSQATCQAPEVEDPYGHLTNREREVLHLLAEGLSNRAIAERLSISPRTAETHRANLMRKLGLRNHAEIVRYAVRRGLIDAEA